MTFLDIATPLIAMGIPITPVRPGSKRAILPDFPTTASTDLAQIQQWNAQYPDHNAACVARAEVGGVFFFEVDSADVLPRITADTTHDLLTEVPTFRVQSRPGRGHFYFRHNAESLARLTNLSQTYVKGGDWSLRMDREYVVAPGSIHPETGLPYTVKNPGAPILEAPPWLIEWLLSQRVNATKTVEAGKRWDDDLRNENGRIPHGKIHGWMLTVAGRMRAAELEQDEIEPALLRAVHENCEPPIDEGKVVQMSKSICNFPPGTKASESKRLLMSSETKVAEATADLGFKLPAVEGTHRDYVVNPKMGQRDGWFPLGSVSLIGGSSGSNKTTWALDLLVAQQRGEHVWGHSTNGRRYLVFMFDRGADAHKRTMERLGFATTLIPTAFLSPVTDELALKTILDQIESKDTLPEVVFIEGADMLVKDANKGEFVVPFMSGLQRIAEHYHIAIILSVGAPKTKAGEGYTAKRDSILGSEKWSRMSETVVALQFVEGDDTDSRRACFVLLRNGPAERFNLTMFGGKLVVDHSPRPEKPSSEGQSDLAKKWYLTLFQNGEGKWKESITLDEHRKALRTASLPPYALKAARASLGIYYSQQQQAYVFISNPNQRTVDLKPERLEEGLDEEAA